MVTISIYLAFYYFFSIMSILTNMLDKLDEKDDPFVIRTWNKNVGSNTVILSLPKELAQKYGIKVHTNLLATDTGSGILLEKLEAK